MLSHKVQVYLEGSGNHQIKLPDIKKIVQLWVSMDNVAEQKRQFQEFDALVASRIAEIEAVKLASKTESQSSSVSQTPATQTSA